MKQSLINVQVTLATSAARVPACGKQLVLQHFYRCLDSWLASFRLLLTLVNEIENENMSGFKNIIVLNLQQICFLSNHCCCLWKYCHFAICYLPFAVLRFSRLGPFSLVAFNFCGLTYAQRVCIRLSIRTVGLPQTINATRMSSHDICIRVYVHGTRMCIIHTSEIEIEIEMAYGKCIRSHSHINCPS